MFHVSTNGALNTLYSFGGADGANPNSGLIQGANGNLYGTTTQGGSFGDGTIYSMTADGALTTLHSFSGSDGANPYGTLTEATDGSFYGTTQSGGTNDAGTVFRMATDSTVSTLVSFRSKTLPAVIHRPGCCRGATAIYMGQQNSAGSTALEQFSR